MFLGRKLTYMFTHLTYPPSYTYPHIPHPHIPTLTYPPSHTHPHIPTLTCTPLHTHPHTYTLTHTLTYPPSHPPSHPHTYPHLLTFYTHPHTPTPHTHTLTLHTYPHTPTHFTTPTLTHTHPHSDTPVKYPTPVYTGPPIPLDFGSSCENTPDKHAKSRYIHNSSYLHQLFQRLTCLRSYCSVCICSIPPWLVNISLTYFDKWYIPPHIVDWSMYPTL